MDRAVAVQGQPSLASTGTGPSGAFDAARTLLDSVRSALKEVRLVSRGQAVGRYRAPWGGEVALRSEAELVNRRIKEHDPIAADVREEVRRELRLTANQLTTLEGALRGADRAEELGDLLH